MKLVIQVRRCNCDGLKDAIDEFWNHFSSFSAVVDPVGHIGFVKDTFLQPNHARYSKVWNINLGDAIARLNERQFIEAWSYLSTYIKRQGKTSLRSLGKGAWRALPKLMNDDDCRTLISVAEKTPRLGKSVAILCDAKPILMDKVMSDGSFEFAIAVMRKTKKTIDVNRHLMLERVCGIIAGDGLKNHEFEFAIQAASKALEFDKDMSDLDVRLTSQIAEYVVNNVRSGVNDNELAGMIELLEIAAVKGVVEWEKVYDIVDLDGDDKVVAASLSVVLRQYEALLENSVWREKVLALAVKHSSFLVLMKRGSWVFNTAVTKDADFAYDILGKLLATLPVDEAKACDVLDFMCSLPIDDVRVLEIVRPARVFESYKRTLNADVADQLVRFIRKFGLEVSYSSVEPVSGACVFGFKFVTEMDIGLVEDLLSFELIDPFAMRHVMDHIRVSGFRSEMLFFGVTRVLQNMMRIMGLPVSKGYKAAGLFLEESDCCEMWVSMESLKELLAYVDGNFYDTRLGLLMEALLNAIEAMIEFDEHKVELCVKTSVLASVLVNLYPIQCVKIIRKVYDGVDVAAHGTMQQGIDSIMERLTRMPIPPSGYVEVAKLVIDKLGYENANTSFSYILQVAMSKDRELASMVSEYVAQPIPPVPTFLSFAHLPQHADWMQICQLTFPPSEWVLESRDIDLIRSLPECPDLQDARNAAIDIIRGMSEPTTEPKCVIPPCEYVFTKVQVEEIDVQIRKTEPATVANITAFLWHSGNCDLPDEVTVEKLEEVVAANPDNMKLLTGFFFWAQAHHHAINVSHWAKVLRISSFDNDAVVAVVGLIGCLRCEWSNVDPEVKSLIIVALQIVGVDGLRRRRVAKLYAKSHGLKWLLAHSIISIDPDHWRSDLQLSAIIGKRPEMLREIAESEDHHTNELLRSVQRIVSELLCSHDPTSFVAAEFVPVTCPFYPNLMAFNDESELPVPNAADANILVDLLTVLKRGPSLPLQFLDTFLNIALESDFVPHVLAKFTDYRFGVPGGEAMRLFQDSGNSSSAVEWFTDKPPSFTRAYVRGSASCFSRRLPVSLEKELVNVLTAVHPALAYSGLFVFGCESWESASPSSLFRLGRDDRDVVQRLVRELDYPMNNALSAARGLLGLPEAVLSRAMPTVVVGASRHEVIRRLLFCAVSESSHVLFAVQAVRILLKLVTPEDIAMVIAARDFVNQPNFACIFSIFVLFEKSVSQNMRDYCSAFHDPEQDIFCDSSRSRIFSDISDPISLSAALK